MQRPIQRLHLRPQPIDLPRDVADFDLTLTLHDDGADLRAALEYSERVEALVEEQRATVRDHDKSAN